MEKLINQVEEQAAAAVPVATPFRDEGIKRRRVKAIESKDLATSSNPLGTGLPPPSSSIYTPVILPQKRPLPVVPLDLNNNFPVVMAPIAAVAVAGGSKEKVKSRSEKVGVKIEEAFIRMSKAMERFVETYERVELMKLQQMVDLEEKRIKLIKDLEVQRTKFFMDTLVKLEKMKQSKGSGSSDA